MRTVARIVWLHLREGFKAFGDPEPHDHTKPWHGRCTRCGHRIPTRDGEVIVETRRLPLGKMLTEVTGRVMAILQGA